MKRKFIIFATLLLLLPFMATGATFSNESLKYVITYKWGLIHKDAADATLSLRNQGNNYVMTLTAKTKPWADRIFEVRDTLRSVAQKNGFRPLNYTKISHEGGKYAKDEIKYTYSGNTVLGSSKKTREKNGQTVHSTASMHAQNAAYDMLSIFYYLRMIDYDRLKSGEVFKTTVFSGSKSETLSVKSLGTETVTLRDKSKRRARKIEFTFTSKGKKKSSDDIECWISDDSSHIPLLLIGKLPIGQVRVYYTGG